MKKTVLLLFLGAILCGCSPKITSNLVSNLQPLGAEDEVVVVDLDGTVPESAVFLGTVKIGDTGFTATKNGTYDAVIGLAKEKARQAGGNVVLITRHQFPDRQYTIHRIQADVFRVDEADLSLLDKPIVFSDHPDYAIVYIYRPYGLGSMVSYDVYVNDTKVYKAGEKTKAEVKIYEAGDYELWARTESRTDIPLVVELGGEYFVRCTVGMGILVGYPVLEAVSAGIGSAEYNMIHDD